MDGFYALFGLGIKKHNSLNRRMDFKPVMGNIVAILSITKFHFGILLKLGTQKEPLGLVVGEEGFEPTTCHICFHSMFPSRSYV